MRGRTGFEVDTGDTGGTGGTGAGGDSIETGAPLPQLTTVPTLHCLN